MLMNSVGWLLISSTTEMAFSLCRSIISGLSFRLFLLYFANFVL